MTTSSTDLACEASLTIWEIYDSLWTLVDIENSLYFCVRLQTPFWIWSLFAFSAVLCLCIELKPTGVDRRNPCTWHEVNNRGLLNIDNYPFKWSTLEQRNGYHPGHTSFSNLNSRREVTKQEIIWWKTLITWWGWSEGHLTKGREGYKRKCLSSFSLRGGQEEEDEDHNVNDYYWLLPSLIWRRNHELQEEGSRTLQRTLT